MKDMALWNEGDWVAAIATVILAAFLAAGLAIAASRKEEALGHPKGLYMLFFAEMWERFSFYGMRALLIFYLTAHWLFSDGEANVVYGAYGAMVYITPVLGGWLADRYIGQRKAVLFGGALLALGHLFMAFEGTGGQDDPTINVFWLALALIIVGSGFLKANISVMVGQLYKITDARRDAAYTIFYMGINVGAAAGTILVGYLGQTLGWAYGFGLAGIGMVAGLIVFVLGRAALRGAGEPPALLPKNKEMLIYAVSIAAVGAMWLLIQYREVIQTLLIVSGVALLGYVLYEAMKLPKEPRERIFAILFLVALNPVFWGLFEQGGGSLNLYTDRYTDIGDVPAAIFQSINPIYIILFAPVFAALWQWLGRKGLEPSAPAKFALALFQVGAGFLVFVWGAQTAGMGVLTPVIFLFLIYLLHTTGELCLSPVGLSAMNRLAPSFMASLIMGAWFYMTAVGSFVAGKIGEATGGEAGDMSQEMTLSIYNQIGWVAIGVGVVVLALSPIVKRWMHLDTLGDDNVTDDLVGGGDVAEPQAAGIHPEVRS
ncbi:peptide MFS transporter [Alteraurantiacibacter aquimixticola]|uniref:MFS transporter n=1 Tax=Alteraurantiacibacter aquimixticola TaxID=2489173 RepID=A0A4T3EYB0_9SPHN|nr:peptide MFS transporter [Alteraurantiacibacter aquimixticola]TIX49051.1 MFS transporter [Alteraurantiacibacter aquimixticola]